MPAADLALGTNFISQLHYWRNEVGRMNEQQLQQLQRQRLTALLQHAISTITYYRSLGVTLSGDPYHDIRQFPVLYKTTIRENFNGLFVGDRSKLISEKSSGSSGVQGEVLMSKKENSAYQAAQTWLWEWNGYRLGEKMMQTGMTLNRGFVKGMKDKLLHTQYVNAYNISYDIAVQQLTNAKQNDTRFLGGYASSLNAYAEIALKAGIDIQFDGVFSWGDKLFDHYKANLKKAFSNPSVTEHYGTTEGFVISGMCREGYHHQLTPQTYLELLDTNGNPVADGELGHVVATRLDAYSFPLIRYYLGDLAIRGAEGTTCACGRKFPILKKIVGRDTDIVSTPSGKYLIVHFFTGIMEHYATIRQFRVVQRQHGAIEIEYIPSPEFEENVLDNIRNIMHERAGEVFPIEWKKVAEIPATPSGKPQIVQNLVVKRTL